MRLKGTYRTSQRVDSPSLLWPLYGTTSCCLGQVDTKCLQFGPQLQTPQARMHRPPLASQSHLERPVAPYTSIPWGPLLSVVPIFSFPCYLTM